MDSNKLTTISQAMMKPVFSLALSGNILGIIKKRLLEEAKFESFPLLVLIGAPKTGKSAVFKAAIPDATKRKSTVDGFRTLNQFIKQTDAEYVLVDDVSETSSTSKKQQYARIIDDIGRAAYEGSSCIIGITMEEITLKYFPESAIQRMLMVNTNDFWNSENQALTKKLRLYSDTLTSVIDEFRVWFAEQQTSFAEKLNSYEILHAADMENNSRLVHTTFAYQTAVEYYFKFLQTAYSAIYNSLNISVPSMLAELVKPFFESTQTPQMRRVDLFLKSFWKAMQNQTFVIQKPEITESICKKYAYGECLKCEGFWGFQYHEDECSDSSYAYPEICNCYNPADLVIRANYNALFLKDASCVPQFPKYLKDGGKHPVLLIQRDILLTLINQGFRQICAEEHKHDHPFHVSEMIQALYHLNMLMFLPEANSNRYSITHYYENFDKNEENQATRMSVLILRLTPELAQRFDEKTNSFCPEVFQQKYAMEMAKSLVRNWSRLVISYGTIGQYYA